MLIGLNPLLNADVLYALRAMGHGDDLIIADTNFPSDSVARETVLGEVLRIDASAAEVVRAVLSVYPIDTFVEDAAARMEVVGAPAEILPVMQEV
ncbi:MAG: ribose ABC transporter, partial [Rhodobacteraceae bacterium]|nr:ribose ABC transporter [Paracoccaceae bacterium]